MDKRYTGMRLDLKPTNSKGDTIVEVLIAVAIVSSVLVAAFLVTQKSAIAVRDSQERGEMLQRLQGQVELVRALAAKEATDTTGVFDTTPNKYFCIKETSPTYPRNNLPASLNDYAGCTFGSNGLYKIDVTYDSAMKVFTFRGTWDRVGGGEAKMQLNYRVYPGGS